MKTYFIVWLRIIEIGDRGMKRSKADAVNISKSSIKEKYTHWQEFHKICGYNKK